MATKTKKTTERRRAKPRSSPSSGSEALTFEQGYVCAVATMLSQHGDSVCAKDMLGCMGNIDWSKIDEYDREIIKEYGLLP